LSQTTLHPGEPLAIDLYWDVTARPPGNYLLFVHLIDDIGTIIAQRDTHPGLGNFPASQWRPGDHFVESIRLYLPETTYTPAQASLSIGLYAPVEGYRLGITADDGTGLGDTLVLGQVTILPQDGSSLPNALDQNFNNEIRLLGYEYDKRVLQPGEILTVTLYWEALSVPEDYEIQVHLVDENDSVRTTADHRPTPPTTQWQPGQQVQTQHQFTISPDLSPGDYIIHAALLAIKSQKRQNIVAEDGHWINDHLSLSRVNISP
jgi:hypothetical protein